MLLYYLDLLGVAVFAASGVLAARDRNLDLFGVTIVATVTAIGGGTLRDLLLNRHPIFWIVDNVYLIVILAATALTLVCLRLRLRPGPRIAFLVADALGLGLFAMMGAKLTTTAGHAPLIVVVMGTMTGVTGGALRDVLTAHVPLIFQREIYATAAMAGVVLYIVLLKLGVSPPTAFGCGFATVVTLRLIAIQRGLHLPVFRDFGS